MQMCETGKGIEVARCTTKHESSEAIRKADSLPRLAELKCLSIKQCCMPQSSNS